MATWKTSQPPGDYSALPASVNIVDWIPAPTGGYWLLGDDGGVFAVGGAPFMGGYTTLQGQDPNRKFEHIQRYITPDGQVGYSLLSTEGQQYGVAGEFAPAPLPPKPPLTPLGSDPTVSSTSASASVQGTLASFGLVMDQGTIDTLTTSFRTGGISQFLLDLEKTDQYKQRFPAMAALNAAGHHIDEATYMGLENTYAGTMNAYGIPAAMQSDVITKFIEGRVSPVEVNSRIQDAATAAYQSPPELRAALSSMYGLTGGELISFFIDPVKSTNIIQQRVLAGAQTGAAAQGSGWGALTNQEAENIGFERGVTPADAASGFGTLFHERQLFDPLGAGDATITRDQQLAAQFGGSGPDQEAIANVAARRRAAFGGGGGFTQGGVGTAGE